jgi:hypothetical protein
MNLNLTKLDLFTIPEEVVDETERNLRRAGKKGLELFVLWSGVVNGTEFIARTAHVPLQTSYQLDSGLMVRVEGDALHQLNEWLYTHEEILAVQIHAHPTEAFHSGTDDAYPIVTGNGSISIVVADFCRHGLFSASTAVYRLDNQSWRELDPPFGLFQVKKCL